MKSNSMAGKASAESVEPYLIFSAACAFAFEQQVSLADGVGFGVDFLAKEVNGDVLAVLISKLVKVFFGHGEHAAGAAGAVVDAVGGVDSMLSAIGLKIRLAMSFTTSRGVKCSPASSLFSSLNRRISSSKIVPMAWLSRPGRRSFPSWSNTGSGLRLTSWSRELLDEAAEDVGLHQRGDLVAELEFVQNFLDVGGKTVEVGLEVGLELLLFGPGPEVPQGEGRDVIESVPGRVAQRSCSGWRRPRHRAAYSA